jgi:hypothetical protein
MWYRRLQWTKGKNNWLGIQDFIINLVVFVRASHQSSKSLGRRNDEWIQSIIVKRSLIIDIVI